jgi:hypothetical protein
MFKCVTHNHIFYTIDGKGKRRGRYRWRAERRVQLHEEEAGYDLVENVELLEEKIRREELKRALF